MKYFKKIIKGFLALITLLLLVLIVFFIHNSFTTSYLKIKNTKNSYIIKNVNVIPMTKDTVFYHTSVLVKEGIIEQISDSLELTDVEDVIDGENMYLSPGLIDMHIHLWDKQELGLYLANGITTVRNLWGYPLHLRVKDAIDNKEITGPMFYVSSPKLTGKLDFGDDKVQVNSAKEAKEFVVSYKKRGFDFIKTYAGIPKDLMDAVIEQSEISDIPIVAHPSREMPYLDQFQTQIKSLEHAEEIVQQALNYQLDTTMLQPIIQKFVTTNTSFCPTLTGYYKIFEMLNQNDSLLESEMVKYMNPLIRKVDTEAQYSRWANEKASNSEISQNIYNQHIFHLQLLKKMNEAGVNIVCGTDAGIGITTPGFSIHEELNFYKEAGMTNYDVLKTATVNPSKTHKEFNKIGSIEKGKLANFILSKNNPLEDISILKNPEWVMINGRLINKNDLTAYKDNAFGRNTFVITALWYAEYLLFER